MVVLDPATGRETSLRIIVKSKTTTSQRELRVKYEAVMNKNFLKLVEFGKHLKDSVESGELDDDIEKTVNEAASIMYVTAGLFQKILKNSPNTPIFVKLKYEKVQPHIEQIYNDLTTNFAITSEQLEELNKYKNYFDNCLELGLEE